MLPPDRYLVDRKTGGSQKEEQEIWQYEQYEDRKH